MGKRKIYEIFHDHKEKKLKQQKEYIIKHYKERREYHKYCYQENTEIYKEYHKYIMNVTRTKLMNKEKNIIRLLSKKKKTFTQNV